VLPNRRLRPAINPSNSLLDDLPMSAPAARVIHPVMEQYRLV
jgi:hypothetical protein